MKKIIFWLFFVYFLLFPLGQLIRIPPQSTEVSEVHFYLTDVAVATIVVFWFLGKWLSKSRFSFPPLTWPIFLFIACCFWSLFYNSFLLSDREVAIAGLYLIRWVVYAGIYFVVYDLIYNSKLKISNFKLQIAKWLIISGTVSAILGLLQYIFIPDTRFLEKYGWDPHLYRLIGAFFDPGFLGLILVLTLILLILEIWPSKKNPFWKTIIKDKKKVFLIVISYVALALTYSRASYLSYLLSMAFISFFKKSPKFFLAVLFIFILTVFSLPRPEGEGVRLERESTIKYRIMNWQQSIFIFSKNPIFGVGFNAYRFAQRRYGFLNEEIWLFTHAGAGADSSLLLILATTGLVGFSSYLWLIKKILEIGDLKTIVSFLAILVHSTFVNSLLYPWIMAWMWILLGIGNSKEKRQL